jgi:hypothetical protein
VSTIVVAKWSFGPVSPLLRMEYGITSWN